MSIAEKTQSKQYTPPSVAAHHRSDRDYGTAIAAASGVVGSAIALVGAARGSLPIVVAAAVLLGGGALLTAATKRG